MLWSHWKPLEVYLKKYLEKTSVKRIIILIYPNKYCIFTVDIFSLQFDILYNTLIILLISYCFCCFSDRPSAPNGPFIATDIDGESLMLQWQPPKDGDVNNYILEKKKHGTNKWTKCSSFINNPKFTVRNLEPGSEYDFRVMAENDQGVSDALETNEPVLAKLPYGKFYTFKIEIN